ncbi:hypothetical protein [Stenotrophomonas sp. NA06056]|uniref:hypothetical protein n=1 Tax=Stenotrophomonas sp. NA06056 TaxID=2742129 RepID=UPI00158A8D45|nr:hypothetical protein [Stenotrophomonas sp. NA06056]QKW56725.1 hypothetical protein HUT07_08885 [Stenotrophomonas sp. NA06056]
MAVHDDRSTFALMERGRDGRFHARIGEEISSCQLIRLIVAAERENSNLTLVDFAPAIKEFERLHVASVEQNISTRFNTMFDLWLEFESLETGGIPKAFRAETLSTESAHLLIELEEALDLPGLVARRITTPYLSRAQLRWLGVAERFLATLMCRIHAKACAEIKSYMRDSSILNKCLFIEQRLAEALRILIAGERGWLQWDSLIYFLALQDPDSHKITILENLASAARANGVNIHEDVRIDLLNRHHQLNRDDQGHYLRLPFERPWDGRLEMAKRVCDLLTRANGLRSLVEDLMAGDIEWDSGQLRLVLEEKIAQLRLSSAR